MTIDQLNKAISLCNPYTDKALLRSYIKQRRRLQVNQSITDILTGNVPQSMRKQSGCE